MSHPIIKVTQAAAKKNADGAIYFDAEAVALIEYGLQKYGDDPSIGEAVVGLVELALSLRQNVDSPEAAATLMKILAAQRDKLPALKRGTENAKLAGAFEQMKAFSGEDTRRRAPKFGEALPEGAVKASSFLEPAADMKPRSTKPKLRRGIPKT